MGLLGKYYSKRDFKKTAEPRGTVKKSKGNLSYVIQKHHARRLHYDFRLEFEGVLKSWAVPKGPSLNPKDKRLAVETEDHPIDYAGFEGDIPKGEYGGGHVIVWDNGEWTPLGDIKAGLKKGHIDFELNGQKLSGRWSLVRLKKTEKGKNNWLLIKKQDEAASEDFDIVEEMPDSVLASPPKAATAPSTQLKKTKSKKSKLASPPRFVEPQLARLVESVPQGKEWLHEMKFDGYRTQCRIDGNKVQFFTRNGLDWSGKYKSLKSEIQKLPTQNALLDGEIVWIDDRGHASFQGLQNAISEGHYDRVLYYVFDILHYNGEDVRVLPLEDRKKILETLLKRVGKRSKILYSQHWKGTTGREMLAKSCALQLEGVVSKDATQPYRSGRSDLWRKTKCSLRQEFVIGGFTDSPKASRAIGALLMGFYDENHHLRYAGKVGTGFTESTLADLVKKLKPLKIKESPFDINSPTGRLAHWVKPQLIGEVEFKAWTGDKVIRHGSFQGLRTDKDTKDVQRDVAVKTPGKVQGVRISHPERISYPASGTRKWDVVDYYDAVSDLMLPFLKDRPMSLLRCQELAGENCFFQKHAEGRNLIGLGNKPVHYKDKKDTAIVIENRRDIIEAVQAGTIEFHGWQAKFSKITKPDLIVFDLDPESLKLWSRVVDTAHEIRDMLQQLGLESFVKVTGGKGLHVQVPIVPNYEWDDIKAFSKSLMKVLENREPKNYTTNMIKARRKNRIFLDYLRNGYGATAVIPYSVRAREEPAVALPIAWSQLKDSLRPNQFLIPEVPKLIKNRKDPWAGYFKLKQWIPTALLGKGEKIPRS